MAPAPAADTAVGQRLDFAPGETETSVQGALSGFATTTYVVDAGAGQQMQVTLAADNDQTVFNVIAPDATTPLFNGARKGRSFGQMVDRTGTYTIEVALSRAAARRSQASAYTLTVAVTGEPVPAAEAQPVAPAAHRTGALPAAVGAAVAAPVPLDGLACAANPADALTPCTFSVDRGAQGAAVVRVTLPDGSNRLIRFVNGEAVTSDGTGGFTARHQAGTTEVGIGNERFAIPDAVVRGS